MSSILNGIRVNVLTESENKLAQLEMALSQARQATKNIKYDNTVNDIIAEIQGLAQKYGMDAKTVKWAISDVIEAKNNLESAVYGLEEVFKDAWQNEKWDQEDKEGLAEGKTADMRAFFAGVDSDKSVPTVQKSVSPEEIKKLMARLLATGERSLTPAQLELIKNYQLGQKIYRKKLENEGVAEGWQEDSQELEDWSKEVNKKLYRAHESQRPALAKQLSKIEQKNFGSSLNKGSLTQVVHSALMALQKGQMVHYDPQSVGSMPFGNIVGDDARVIANSGLSKYDVDGYRGLQRAGIVDNIEQFLHLRDLADNQGQAILKYANMPPVAAWMQFIKDIGWSKDDMNEEVQAKTDDKLLAYYAQRKAEKEKQKQQQGVAEAPTRVPAIPNKILSATDDGKVITIKVRASDGSTRSMSNPDPSILQKWLNLKFGLRLPQEISSKFVFEFAPPGGDEREPDEEAILKKLASIWWNGSEGEMSKAEKTLASMGWEIGLDESGDDDAGVFVIRAGDVNGDTYMAFPDSELKLDEAHTNYHANRTGFSRGPRDDERHDLDVARQQWALKINGKVWSKDGKAVTFDSKEKALKARQSLLAKKPDLEVGLVTRQLEGYSAGAVGGAGLGIEKSPIEKIIERPFGVDEHINSPGGMGQAYRKFKPKSAGVAEGAPELLKAEMPLVRHIEQELAKHGVQKDDPEYKEKFKHAMAYYRKFGNIDAIKKDDVAEEQAPMFTPEEKMVNANDPRSDGWRIYKAKPAGTKESAIMKGLQN